MTIARRTARGSAALAVASTLLLAGCSSNTTSSAQDDNADDGYPVTVENCGAEVSFDAPPEQLVLLKSASVPALHALGVLDRTVARAGAFPSELFDDETNAEIQDIPELTSDIDPTGHLQISKDVVIAEEPDVVFGEVENLPRQSLSQVNIALLEEPAFCSTDAETDPTFDSVYDQVQLYGEVFDRTDKADDYVDELEQRVADAEDTVADDEDRTAAVLYPTVGGGTMYAYGTDSMAHPQLEAAGFTNAFEDTSERVFEVSAEQLLGRDPDIIILLYSEGDPEAVEATLEDLPGASDLSALENDQVITQLLNFTEPATPLAVTGLENIVERFHE